MISSDGSALLLIRYDFSHGPSSYLLMGHPTSVHYILFHHEIQDLDKVIGALKDATPLLESSDSGAYERFLRFLFRFVCPKWLSSLTVARRREYVDPLVRPKGCSPVMVVVALSEVLVGAEEAPGEGRGLPSCSKACMVLLLFFFRWGGNCVHVLVYRDHGVLMLSKTLVVSSVFLGIHHHIIFSFVVQEGRRLWIALPWTC